MGAKRRRVLAVIFPITRKPGMEKRLLFPSMTAAAKHYGIPTSTVKAKIETGEAYVDGFFRVFFDYATEEM